MTDIIKPGAGVLFMKVGVHAKESLADIIARKSQEIRDEGFAMWGYGGATCHPRTMVQPFAHDFVKLGQNIHLCMQEVNSNHFADPVRAEQYSEDGLKWEDIPEGINVLGSRYALVIRKLREDHFRLSLENTEVAVGNSKGRLGSKYIAGRVDKACLLINNQADDHVDPPSGLEISLVAELVEPFAVFLRNRPK